MPLELADTVLCGLRMIDKNCDYGME